jgi:hypothetical protein
VAAFKPYGPGDQVGLPAAPFLRGSLLALLKGSVLATPLSAAGDRLARVSQPAQPLRASGNSGSGGTGFAIRGNWSATEATVMPATLLAGDRSIATPLARPAQIVFQRLRPGSRGAPQAPLFAR